MFEYVARFSLDRALDESEVIHAQEFLENTPMRNSIPEYVRGRVISVFWALEDNKNGIITIETNRELRDSHREELADWIKFQCKDTIGEQFHTRFKVRMDYKNDNYEITSINTPWDLSKNR